MNNEVLEQLKREYNETFKRLQELGEVIYNCADIDTNHCGQDADGERMTYRDILGMEVICVGGSAMKCKDCSWNCGNCVKVELVGGDYLCLAEPQNDERPVISFDEEEQEGLGDIMVDIKEKTEDFLNYLDSIFKTKEQ